MFLKFRSRVKNKIKRLLKIGNKSETSKCRERLIKFCQGNGVDLGFGGDSISKAAVRIDFLNPYSDTRGEPVQLSGDCNKLEWFKNGVLDYVYSSHLLEDFEDTEAVLSEWLRVIKPGGLLVLFCPDEQVYRLHCQKTGQYYNTQHKHADFSLEKVKNILKKLGQSQIVHEKSLIDIYSWELVIKKV